MSDRLTFPTFPSVCDKVINPLKVVQLLYTESFFENPGAKEDIIRNAKPSQSLPQLKDILFYAVRDSVREQSLVHFATVLLRYDNPEAGKKLLDSGKSMHAQFIFYGGVCGPYLLALSYLLLCIELNKDVGIKRIYHAGLLVCYVKNYSPFLLSLSDKGKVNTET